MAVEIINDDCREILKWLPDDVFDSIVTDPPYSLVSIQKRFGKPGQAPAAEGVYRRSAAGFMGKQWDTGETAFDPTFWVEVLRVLKPGAHLLAFGGTRTYHRLACAIDDAGFDVRDAIMWHYGTGFPKSHNLDGDWQGWGTALKPATEIICLARKPLIGTVAANVLAHGTGALNIDGCRVETADNLNGGAYAETGNRSVSGSLHAGSGMNQPGKTVGREFTQPLGRWPANLIHDGSDEVLAAFPDTGASSNHTRHNNEFKSVAKGHETARLSSGPSDSGSAARFFYSAKASTKERAGSKHPTVKPIALMEYLVRLVTPPGGTVLDPFAGSGTTGIACQRQGFNALLIEREAEYIDDIQNRLLQHG